ncbi:hypothetical protein ACFWY9_16570 [Amycolatopsis sp. NPDC059027]|uniref:hypothetical protein n=1 Tax=Amycolatopsis sp. NPDC059027 TaxID=3346709 RepID=UPI00366AF412
MRSTHISRRAAEAAYDGTDEFDVLAAQEDAVLAFERLEVAEELDAVTEEIERELSVASQLERYAFLYDFTDQTRASRTRRRAGRRALAAVPARLSITASAEGEAA